MSLIDVRKIGHKIIQIMCECLVIEPDFFHAQASIISSRFVLPACQDPLISGSHSAQ